MRSAICRAAVKVPSRTPAADASIVSAIDSLSHETKRTRRRCLCKSLTQSECTSRWRVGDHVICSDSRCEAKFRITNEATASAEKLQCPRCGSSLCLFRRDRLPLLAVDPHAEQDAAMQQDSKNRSKTNGTVNGWTIQSLGKSELVCDGPDAEIIRSVANSDQRTAFLLLIPSKSLSEREGLLISGATACHECGRNILYKLKTGWSGLFDQVHSDGFSCTQCKVEIRVHGLRVRHRGAQVLLLYSEPFTQHQSRQPNAVRISVTQIDLLGAQNAFF